MANRVIRAKTGATNNYLAPPGFGSNQTEIDIALDIRWPQATRDAWDAGGQYSGAFTFDGEFGGSLRQGFDFDTFLAQWSQKDGVGCSFLTGMTGSGGGADAWHAARTRMTSTGSQGLYFELDGVDYGYFANGSPDCRTFIFGQYCGGAVSGLHYVYLRNIKVGNGGAYGSNNQMDETFAQIRAQSGGGSGLPTTLWNRNGDCYIVDDPFVGYPDPQIVAWTYDGGPGGSGVVSVTFDSEAGQVYALYADGAAPATVTGDGSPKTLTVSDAFGGWSTDAIVQVALIQGFVLGAPPSYIYDAVRADLVAASACKVGTPGEFTNADVTWNYDGAKTVDVTFTGISSGDYEFHVLDLVNGDTAIFPVGTGAPQTESITVTLPLSGVAFYAILYDYQGVDGYAVMSNRLFLQDVAGPGFPGVPGSIPPEPPVCTFYAPQWRTVVTTLNSRTLTFLDRLAMDREVIFTRGKAAEAQGRVPADSPEINLTYAGAPYLSKNDRLLFMLRREGCPTPYVCRFAGVIEQLEDQGDDAPYTTYVARDPWSYLYRRPVLTDGLIFPGIDGISFDGVRGNVIALALINNTIAANGPCYIDVSGGTIVDTDPISINFPRGTSVGEAWDLLVQTGSIDIVLDPIYDPMNRPGLCCTLSIYPQSGSQKHSAIFAWDEPSRSLAHIDRLEDGSQLVNKVRPYAGQPPVAGATQSDPTSVARYGENWAQQSYPGQGPGTLTIAELLALAQIELRKNGLETVTISPAPERAPFPFNDYYIGDEVPVYASNRLRRALKGLWRVESMPVKILDNGTEQIEQILLSQESEAAPAPAPAPAGVLSGALGTPSESPSISFKTPGFPHL